MTKGIVCFQNVPHNELSANGQANRSGKPENQYGSNCIRIIMVDLIRRALMSVDHVPGRQ